MSEDGSVVENMDWKTQGRGGEEKTTCRQRPKGEDTLRGTRQKKRGQMTDGMEICPRWREEPVSEDEKSVRGRDFSISRKWKGLVFRTNPNL